MVFLRNNMIPVSEFRRSLEKTAGPVGKAAWKGIGGTLKFMGEWPKTTLGAVIATAGAVALADKVHPLHQMFREETKNVILKDQNKILLDILKSSKEKPIKPKGQKRVAFPLT